MFERSENERRFGLVARPMVTASWVALTGRVGWFFESRTTIGEIGLLFRIPNAF